MSAMRLRTALLVMSAASSALSQQPPPRAYDGPSIGLVSLGMDAFGRERLCEQLPDVFLGAAQSVDRDLKVEVACEGGPRNRLLLSSVGFSSRNRAQELGCDLIRTPLALFLPKLEIVWIRRGEPPKSGAGLALALESLSIRDLGGFLDAAGFASMRFRRDAESQPLLQSPVYRFNASCG